METDIRITLIEDHDLTRVGMRTALQQRSGFKVVGEAANGTDGLLQSQMWRSLISACLTLMALS